MLMKSYRKIQSFAGRLVIRNLEASSYNLAATFNFAEIDAAMGACGGVSL